MRNRNSSSGAIAVVSPARAESSAPIRARSIPIAKSGSAFEGRFAARTLAATSSLGRSTTSVPLISAPMPSMPGLIASISAIPGTA